MKAAVWDFPGDPDHRTSMIVSEASTHTIASYPEVLIITERPSSAAPATQLAELLKGLGISTALTTLAEAEPIGKVCIVLHELEQAVLYEPTSENFGFVKKILLESDGVLWVVRGAVLQSSDPTQNLISGLIRTVRSEKGDTTLVTLDLSTQSKLSQSAAANSILDVFKKTFNLNGGTLPDVEYVERNGSLMIPRVIEDKEMNKVVGNKQAVPEDRPFQEEGRELSIQIGTPGLLDTLHFVDDDMMTGELPDDSVEIEIKASGINFRDVMMAMGQINVEPFGGECSGVISAIGKSVEGWNIGDRVVTYKIGCFSNHVRQQAKAIQRLPDDMSFEVGASLPVAYCTAYQSIVHAAHLRKGETVLIHAATGGLGQATIGLCQLIGAEIFATVGTIEKRKFLMSEFGIPEDHIFSSRDGTFATGGTQFRIFLFLPLILGQS